MSQSALFFGILDKALPFAMAFLGALVLTLLVTPLIRELNRSLGMVDRPGPRRINAKPVPRGGGIAIVIGVFVSYTLFVLVSGRHPFPSANMSVASFWKMVSLATAISVLGLADDRFGLRPLVKLAGQLAIASLVWLWAGLGFSGVWPSLPPLVDFALTVFWITGAVNAFNLIDGLDGLATGIALIATLGMAGSLFIVDTPAAAIFYFALAGGLLGFLRYNYNPASVFLGDAGSMFLGFLISTLALASQVHDSLFVSVGVPMLAMGVPIFDSSLAIMRRSVRHMLLKQGGDGVGNDRIMTADADHLHHRILRAFRFNQRRAALALYAIALGAVVVGLAAMTMRSRTGGLWLVAVAIGSVVVFKNMARIELFDVGRLLELIAHDARVEKRTFWARLAIPTYLVLDIAALAGSFVFMIFSMNVGMKVTHYTLALLVHLLSTLVALLLAGTYRTVWSRAMMSNYVRLFVACLFGSVAGCAAIYFMPVEEHNPAVFAAVYAALSFFSISLIRIARPLVRDVFYAIDCSRLRERKDVSRILVYGSGLRYRAFRRELVRTASANERMIVGIIDDDFLLRGLYIGGVKIFGTLLDAAAVINELNVDTVVIAFEATEERIESIKQTLRPTGVKIRLFSLRESEI